MNGCSVRAFAVVKALGVEIPPLLPRSRWTQSLLPAP
jgi:hypothetical protein